ncbi:MAG TPA: pseudouridine synthase, partial [Agriterribacter sp.]|nr:pseudouridine synthase [Agriterribacter sp.]
MSRKPFDKFINKAESGAKKKERIRQEKKKIRAEKNAYFDEQKKLARERRTEGKFQGTGSRVQGASYKALGTGQRVEAKGQRTEDRRERTGGKVQGAGLRAEGRGLRVEGKKNETPQKRAPGVRKTGSQQQKTAGEAPVSSLKPVPRGGSPISNQEMPLNKFIAWSGVCGRREAAELIRAGKVTVNRQVITEPPFRVSQLDSIQVNGRKIAIQKNLVYILLNKPKDYITTTDDPEGRKTVMDLVKRATTERVFPVGRLDRNTTGVLLITNDGELAQRLTHPKYEVKKIYEVHVDKPVTKQQLDKIASGITLEDGFIRPDAIAYADAKDKSVVGIEIHSGRNRIVRRIFEHLGFKVKNLDRVMYGIFTKKNIDRGKWRLLTEKEIR